MIFFFKMHLLVRIGQNSNTMFHYMGRVCFIMVLTDSPSGPYDAIFAATLGLNISETRPDSGMVPMDSIWESAYGLSYGHAPDDVERPDNVIMRRHNFPVKWFFSGNVPMVYLYDPSEKLMQTI